MNIWCTRRMCSCKIEHQMTWREEMQMRRWFDRDVERTLHSSPLIPVLDPLFMNPGRAAEPQWIVFGLRICGFITVVCISNSRWIVSGTNLSGLKPVLTPVSWWWLVFGHLSRLKLVSTHECCVSVFWWFLMGFIMCWTLVDRNSHGDVVMMVWFNDCVGGCFCVWMGQQMLFIVEEYEYECEYE